jgi:hypothetical protein
LVAHQNSPGVNAVINRRSAFLLAGSPLFGASPSRAAPGKGTFVPYSNATLDGYISVEKDLDQAIGARPRTSNVRLYDIEIDSRGSIQAGHGIHLNAPNLENWSLSGLRIEAKGYGLLINAGAGNSERFSVFDFRIQGGADAIEFNSPKAPIRNSVVWGGHLSQVGGTDSNAGFALGVAHVDGLIAGGFISHGSRLEAVHVEDGSRLVVLGQFLLRNCSSDGIRLLPGGNHPADYQPTVITGFAIEGTKAGDSTGIYCVYDPSGVAGRTVSVGGHISGFDVGLRFDGPALQAASHISVENANVVLDLGDGGRAPGTFFSRGVNAFVRARGHGVVGRFHQEDKAPDQIVDRRGPGICLVEGFSYPVSPNSERRCLLFRTPQAMRGHLSLIGKGGIGMLDTHILLNNQKLTCEEIISSGDLLSAKIGMEDGWLVLDNFHTGPLTLSFWGAYFS